MPIYEYMCKNCGNVFEALARMSDTETPRCPECGKQDTRKLMSAFSSRGGESGASACGPSKGGFS